MYSSNTCPNCDPVKVKLEGRVDGTSDWVVIFYGNLPWKFTSPARNDQRQNIDSTYESPDPSLVSTTTQLSNEVAYLDYKVTIRQTRVATNTEYYFGDIEIPGIILP